MSLRDRSNRTPADRRAGDPPTDTVRAPATTRVAKFISEFTADDLPDSVRSRTELLVFDAIGVAYAAVDPCVSSGVVTGGLAQAFGGPEEATLFGRERRVAAVNAVLANGTLGYAIDFEPHHPEAILHPLAVVFPTAFAVAEKTGSSGRDVITAIALGCEIMYRLSMAMGPRALYERGFHPSAVCGTFGAAATAAWLLGLDTAACQRALGLAGLQASGLMAWQDDSREDARPFQMGMAARNGLTAALLAESGFGAPDRILDGGHTVFRAFSDDPKPQTLGQCLGRQWAGVTELAIKPWPCVSFLHPALDAMTEILAWTDAVSVDFRAIDLRFARSGCHCIDANPLRGHCAQYVLPVFAATGRLRYQDLFRDRRRNDPEIARLARATTVTPDDADLQARFPDVYACELRVTLSGNRQLMEKREVAPGYPERPFAETDIARKFDSVLEDLLPKDRRRALAAEARNLGSKSSVAGLAALLAYRPG